MMTPVRCLTMELAASAVIGSWIGLAATVRYRTPEFSEPYTTKNRRAFGDDGFRESR
jgi:hypothetical protein